MKKVTRYHFVKIRLIQGIIILLFLGTELSAQEVISPAGTSYENTSIAIDFTVGELAIQTESTNQTIVTQGFHQNFKTTITALKPMNLSVEVSVFPNPTSDFINIASEDYKDDIIYSLYNLNGVLITQGTFNTSTNLSIKSYTKGMYQLLLTNSNQQLIQTFKILLK